MTQLARLGKVAEVVAGVGFPKDMQGREDAEVPVFKVGDISAAWTNGQRLLRSSRNYLTVDEAASLGRLVPAGSTVFAKIGEALRLNRRAVLAQPSLVDNNVMGLVPRRDVLSPMYLFYFMQTVDLGKLSRATAVPSIRKSDVVGIPVPVPTLAQQEVIVAEIEQQFSRLDEAVANLKRVKANLKRYKAAILQASTRGDFTGQSAREIGGSLPPRWRWFSVEQLASLEPRSIQSGPFGSNLKHSEFQATGWLVIGIDNVQDGEFSRGSNHRISEAKFAELAKYAARPRDVLITVMATVGRVCVVPEQIEPSVITKHVYRITVNRELAVPEYLAIALRGASEVRAQLLGSVQGQTRPGLNGTLIKKIRIPTPSVDEQHRIIAEVDRRLSLSREVEAEVDVNLKRSQALGQSILQQAFSGSRSDSE